MKPSIPVGYVPNWLAALRTTARLLAVAILGLVGLFLMAEELHPVALTPIEQLQMAALLVVNLGLVVGLRWEGLGGTLTVSAALFFCVLEGIGSGRFPEGWIFAAIGMPGVLYLICRWATLRLLASLSRVPPVKTVDVAPSTRRVGAGTGSLLPAATAPNLEP